MNSWIHSLSTARTQPLECSFSLSSRYEEQPGLDISQAGRGWLPGMCPQKERNSQGLS